MQKANREIESFDLTQIPMAGLVRLGRIFKQGEDKYGKHNWRNGAGDRNYQIESANHAIKHLMIYVHRLEHGEEIGEPGEDDLAKVAWFCMTQAEIERLEALRK